MADRFVGARADRQAGLMPTSVRQRPDALELWTAFRRHVGFGWNGQTLKNFIAGWDARAGLDAGSVKGGDGQ